MRTLISSAIALAALASAANVAEAACTQRDLAGRWLLTGIGTTGTESVGVQCNLAINRRGRVNGSCIAEVSGIREEAPVFDEALRVRPDCSVGNGGELQLSENGQVMNGIIFEPDIALNLTGIKRPGGRGARNVAQALSSPEHSGCNLLLAQEETSTRTTILRSICQILAP